MTAATASHSVSRVSHHDPTKRSLMWRALQVVARLLTTLCFDLKVRGVEHVPRRGGALLLANHQSYLDPIVVPVRLYRPVSFFAKSALFEHGFLGWLLRNLHGIPVKLGAGDVGAVKETIRRLREGHLLNLYPEGARSADGEIAEIQTGAALIIKRAGVPIIPAVIDGSYVAWPRTHRIFRARPIRVVFGPPLDVEGLDAREITELIGTTLRRMLSDLRNGRNQGGTCRTTPSKN
ncbi:MAG: lysophospholipid acyltransferase family protein [Tepidisphaeraceae bacterium]